MTILSKSFRFLVLPALLSLAGNVFANFHLWRTDQVYSNAGGTVQYIVLQALASGQQFIAGHTISVTQGSTTHTYTFASNLPGDTAVASMDGGGYTYGGGGMMSTTYKSLLLATQGFANLGVVQPDYIIPDGFLFTSNGTINWGGGYDIFSYTSIPMDGNMALFRGGMLATNAPQNFAGDMGQILPESSSMFDVQGLWWNAPAGSESGWGINLTHQGSTIFATWFTYDTDGSGMWISMTGTQSTTNINSYSGTLYRSTGPAFSAVPFDPTKVVRTSVGTGTFTFTDATDGTFAYTLNGVSQTKTLIPLVFSSPVPTCAESGTYGTNYQDLWWNSSESGWGINVIHQGDIIFATWFTYDATGKGLWVSMTATKTSTGVYTGDLYTSSGPAFSAVPFNPNNVVRTKVGTGTFTFTDAMDGTFAYTLNGASQTKAITRLVFSSPTSVCN